MTLMSDLIREIRFLSRQRAAVGLLLACAALSAFAVWSGLSEIDAQRATLEHLLETDKKERAASLSQQSTYGGAAYYTFHLTYDPPSELAFASFGARDLYPWKHRIRMLALEGQIYEADVPNPDLALAGRVDYAFLVSILAPLLVILLLHDLRASERAAGREQLLIATARTPQHLWRMRMVVRSGLLALCLLVPFLVGSALSGAGLLDSGAVCLVVLAHIAFWSVLALWAAHWTASAPTIAAGLLGFWLVLTFVIPQLGEQAVKRLIAGPSGGDIIMTQREAVNDAWDLPKALTMDAFVERHPDWADYTDVSAPFEWKWYYAFQQVGDQTAEPLSMAYREVLSARDGAAGFVALLSPPSLTRRWLSSLAGTDAHAAQAYEQRVRDFHKSLREFYYPLLFKGQEFDRSVMGSIPAYAP